MKALSFVFAAAAALALVSARQAEAQSAPKAAESSKEDYVTDKGFASRVFEVKHREAADLAVVLRPLGSGFKGATMSANREFRTISVRDFPENIAAMEAALKRLDAAEAAKADVELRLWVLVASNSEAGGARLPEELKEAVSALKTTLSYRDYSPVGSFVARIRDGARGISGEGVTDLAPAGPARAAGKTMQLEYRVNALTIEPGEAAARTIRLDGFSLALAGGGRAQIKTDVTLRDGEKVVVGTSTVQDRGLVVVVSARVIR
jgi:hypothetical protein